MINLSLTAEEARALVGELETQTHGMIVRELVRELRYALKAMDIDDGSPWFYRDATLGSMVKAAEHANGKPYPSVGSDGETPDFIAMVAEKRKAAWDRALDEELRWCEYGTD